MDIRYFIAKILCRFSRNRKEFMVEYFRRSGISVGKDCNICSNIKTTEAYLISIGNNVTISTEVLFINHDASVGKIFGKENASDLCGRISIGDNCFIGARCTILYGITLANNIIVAAGSVVSKSFNEEGIIIGGNPAKKIGTWNSFAEKIEHKTYCLHGKKRVDAKKIILKEPQKLITR